VPSDWPSLTVEADEAFNLTSFALSLLLVFRTNESYSRWCACGPCAMHSWPVLGGMCAVFAHARALGSEWVRIFASRLEARKAWSGILIRSRDLVRQVGTALCILCSESPLPVLSNTSSPSCMQQANNAQQRVRTILALSWY
jgi:hypothetical protein